MGEFRVFFLSNIRHYPGDDPVRLQFDHRCTVRCDSTQHLPAVVSTPRVMSF